MNGSFREKRSAAPYPPRDESEKEASEGVREAVCLLGRGMLEDQGPYHGPKVHE